MHRFASIVFSSARERHTECGTRFVRLLAYFVYSLSFTRTFRSRISAFLLTLQDIVNLILVHNKPSIWHSGHAWCN